MRKIIFGVAALTFINSSNSAIISVPGGIKSSGILTEQGNYIENGSFNDTQLNKKWEITKGLPGWTSDEIERGLGNVYNANWGNTIVVELDGNHNDILKQSISLESGHYLLSFRWAGRASHIPSSAMSIYWNNQKIFQVSAQDKSIHSESIPISIPLSGNYVLEIRGEGKSDTYGMTVTDFSLTKDSSKRFQSQKKTHSNGQYLIEEKREQNLSNFNDQQVVGKKYNQKSDNQILKRKNTSNFNDQQFIGEKNIQRSKNQYITEEKSNQHSDNQFLIEKNTPNFNDQYVVGKKNIQKTDNQILKRKSNDQEVIEEKSIQYSNNQFVIGKNTPILNDQYVVGKKNIQKPDNQIQKTKTKTTSNLNDQQYVVEQNNIQLSKNQYLPNEKLLLPKSQAKKDLQVGSSYYN